MLMKIFCFIQSICLLLTFYDIIVCSGDINQVNKRIKQGELLLREYTHFTFVN